MRPRRTQAAALLVTGWIALAPRTGAAQPDPQPRYAEEPTAGMSLPTTGLAGEHDALSVAANPAGLQHLDGWQLALAIDGIGVTDEDATTPGKGVGVFVAGSLFGGLLPKVGWGMGLEVLSPSRIALAPDPGTPARFTLAHSVALGRMSAFGFAWRHFFDEVGGPLRGLDTFDLGVSTRLNAYAGFGLAVRDLGAPTVAGVPVERRYEVEVVARPTGDDRLELGLGGRVGEVRTDFTNGADIDGWVRGSLRVFRGIYLKAQVDSRSLFQLAGGPATVDTDAREVRELRVIGGLEISLGSVGAAGYGGAAFFAPTVSLVERLVDPCTGAVATVGSGTAGCDGALSIAATSVPALGNGAFSVALGGLPSSMTAVGLIGDTTSASGANPLGLGIAIHVDLSASSLLVPFTFSADAAGKAILPLPIPDLPQLAGASFALEAFAHWAGACSPSPSGWSSSPALALTLLD